jgi:hypothetical protein
MYNGRALCVDGCPCKAAADASTAETETAAGGGLCPFGAGTARAARRGARKLRGGAGQGA